MTACARHATDRVRERAGLPSARFALLACVLAGCAPDVLEPPADELTPAFAPGAKVQQFAFASHRDGNWEIYRVNADGTGLLRLTNNPADDGPNGVGGYEIVWSPDGSRIAFTSNRSGAVEIWMMNSDGTAPAMITNRAGNEHDLAWSPDGTRIAFISNGNGDDNIWTVAPDGSGRAEFLGHAGADARPKWSPNGSKLVFENTSAGSAGVWVVNANATGLVQVALAGGAGPSWSSDGSRIAYERHDVIFLPYEVRQVSDIYTVLPSGGSPVLVVPAGQTLNMHPVWRPQ